MEALHTFIILVILWTGTESTHLTWQLDQSSPAHTVTTCTGQNLALHCSSNTIIRLRNMKMSASTECPNHNCRGWLCMARCYVSPALQQKLATSCSGRQACNLTITTNDMRRGSTNTINYNHLEVGYDCEPTKTISTPMCSSININSTLPINLTSSRYPSPSVQVHNCSCKVTPPANSVILLEAVDVSMGGSIHFYSRHRAVCRYLAKLTINETKTVSWHGLNYLHTSTYHAACTNLTNYITQFSYAHHLSLEYDSVLNSNSRFWIKLSAYQWVSGDNDDEDFDMHDDNDDDNDHDDDDDDDDDDDHDDDDDDDDDDDHHRSRRSHGHHGSRGSHHNIIKRRTWLNVQCQDNHVVSGGPWTDAWTTTTTTSAPTRGPVSTRGPIPTRPVSTRRPIPRTPAPTRGPTPTTPVSTRRPIPTTPTPTRGPIPTRPVPTSGPILIKPVPTSGPEKLPNPTQGPKIPPIPPEEVPTNPKVQVAGNEKQTDGEKTMKETEKLERPGLKHEHILILVGVLAAAFLVMLVVGAFFLYRNCRPSPVVGTIKFNGAYDNAIYQNAVNEKPAKEKETFAYDNVVYAIPSEEKVKL